jgi:hypothetical protein
MKFGILESMEPKLVFDKINDRYLCSQCHEERSEFKERDYKGQNCYSNLLPGFSSEKLTVPIDILVIAEAHGGGRKTDFRKQVNLKEEMDNIGDYYLKKEIEKFHQSEMRKLFNILKNANKTWVFTDLIKCFVWQGDDNELHGKKNREIAIEYCRKYLDEQIKITKPKIFLALGNTVLSKYFKLPKLNHGDKQPINGSSLIFSIFPSRNTADLWVKYGGWNKIVPKLLI